MFNTDRRLEALKALRDTIKLAVGSAEGAQQKHVQYQTNFELPPGSQELVANVARVVSPTQPLYFYYEMYDPARANAAAATPTPAAGADPVRVASNLVFFRGKNHVFETPTVSVEVLGAPDRGAAIFQVEVPTAGLAPGLYTCQVNITDEAGQAFAFPRLTLYMAAGAPGKRQRE